MYLPRSVIAFLAVAACGAALVAGAVGVRPIGPPFGELAYSTRFEHYELRRLVPAGMSWRQFACLAPSSEALCRALFGPDCYVEALSGAWRKLEGLGTCLSQRVAADSWAKLLAKTKPTFVWNDGDMLWVGEDGHGRPQFTLDEAYLYQPESARPRWVLIDTNDGPWDEFYRDGVMGRNLRAVVSLQAKVPRPNDGGIIEHDGYAIILASDQRAGTVYEVGWQGLMSSGSAHPVSLRKIYLLRDFSGRWQFLGEGCGNYYARGGSVESIARVVWMTTNERILPEIHFVAESRWDGFRNGDEQLDDWRQFVTCDEWVLAGAFPATLRRTTSHPYLLTETGDTLETIVEHIVKHQPGWLRYEHDEREKSATREMCRAALTRLNPGLPPGAMRLGTKVRVLDYGDVFNEVKARFER